VQRPDLVVRDVRAVAVPAGGLGNGLERDPAAVRRYRMA
jgi:hypothetical protein